MISVYADSQGGNHFFVLVAVGFELAYWADQHLIFQFNKGSPMMTPRCVYKIYKLRLGMHGMLDYKANKYILIIFGNDFGNTG